MSLAAEPRARRTARDAQLEPSAAAWIALAPTLLLVVAAIVVAGPALGHLLFPARGLHTWHFVGDEAPRPERTEHARFLIALTGPLVLSALTVLLAGRAGRLTPRAARRLVLSTQLLATAFVVACWVAQRRYTFHFVASKPHVVYFTAPTLAAAAAIALAVSWAVGSPRARDALRRLTRESPKRLAAAAALAVLVTVVSLSAAIQTDGTIGQAPYIVGYHLGFTYDEALAVLSGRTPLGDFATQYASLWPYVPAGVMSIVGASVGAFTVTMAALTGTSLLALFDVLRRLTRRSLVALALFLPLLATSLYMMQGPLADRFSLANYFGTQPLRYAGPFLLAWLTARHLDGARPRRLWPLFLCAGLVLANNLELGSAALVATAAAIVWARGRHGAPLRRLALEAAAGVAAALALVTALVVARTGSLPDLMLTLRYPSLFGVTGFAQLPMRPVLGLSTIIYLTYLATIGAATVRAMRGEADRLLTGLLAWAGVFGLGAGSYYIGRSSPQVLANMFPAWAFATCVLVVLVGRELAAMPRLRPTPAQVLCLLAFGAMACSLAQTPTPWSQVRRLSRNGPPSIFTRPMEEEFVAAHARPGEPVALLTFMGHKTAVDLGVVDVTPYTGSRSIQTSEQLDDVVRALRAAHGEKLFLLPSDTHPDLERALFRDGYAPAAEEPGGTQLWTPKAA